MEKGKTKRKDPSPSQKNKTESGPQRGKGTNYVPKPSLVASNILEEEREGKLERSINLEEFSPTTTIHFKIKTDYTLYKVTNTFCL
jgi:hypothetical protein